MSKKILFVVLVCLSVLVLVLMNAVSSFVTSVYEFYYEDQSRKPSNTEYIMYRFIKGLNQNVWLSTISSYLGFDTGYGFFAPNVSSDCLFEMIKDTSSKNNTQEYLELDFNIKENYIRFYGYTKNFLEYIKAKPDSLKCKQCDIFLKQVCRYFYLKDTSLRYLKIVVYLWDSPNLIEKKNKNEVRLYEIRRFIVDRRSLQKNIE